MKYWEDFERFLTAYLKLTFYRSWDYPIRRQDIWVYSTGNPKRD